MTRMSLKILTAATASMTCTMLGLLVCRAEKAPPPPPALVLPAAPVSSGALRPEWTIALFVDFDPAAPESRQAFSQATRAVSQGVLHGPAELRLLHAPAGGCPAAERTTLRCTAARAVECAEGLRPGAGVRLAGAVFDLQWESEELRGSEQVMQAARNLEVDAAKLRRCVAEDAAAEARVREHAAFATAHGLARSPGGYVVHVAAPDQVAPIRATDTAETLGVLSRCLARGSCREAV